MGRYVVKLPDIGEGTTEAEIVAWHVTPGQSIREDDPLVDIMTDKATVELPAPVAGTVVALNGKIGEKRPVGSELVVLDVVGEGNAAETGPRSPTGAETKPPHLVMAAQAGIQGQLPSPAALDSRLRGNGDDPAAPAKSRWPRRRCGGAPGI
jgi:2-oxoisovalerate dehydrogenase E2 component (dihydrolipoyl transacylase)